MHRASARFSFGTIVLARTSRVFFAGLAGTIFFSGAAFADDPAPQPTTSAPSAAINGASTGVSGGSSASSEEAEIAAQGNPGEASKPPPLNIPYLQYGAALAAESVLSAGSICSGTVQPCILGSGAGVAVRIGLRTAGPFYFGGAYELSKQDPGKLYRLAILQQLRFETRYYIDTGRDVQPVIIGGAGVTGYGNEWGVDTFGPMATVGFGFEAQVTRTTVVGLYLSYRAIYLKGFTDPSHSERDPGVAQLLALEFDLGARDPFGEGRLK
ncbi:MAG: hypothetical protein ABI461_21890 [Polyangiaceae bacterium]